MMDYEEKVFVARISDMISLSECRGMVFTHFLNERQVALSKMELKRLKYENYCFFGGVENADRKILCIFNEYCHPENSDFPLSCITFRYKTSYKLSHRDFLGALTSLNLKREAIGDILTDDGAAQVFAINSVVQTIENDINKIGSVGVKVSSDELPFIDKKLSYHEIKGTAASMRLDCILSLALGISRGKVVPFITSGATELNYKPIENTSVLLEHGDVFSVRGHGKFRIEEISGISKKGRLHIIVLKYC